ncbi:Histone deacetylase [Balamuthia mandrillaris]
MRKAKRRKDEEEEQAEGTKAVVPRGGPPLKERYVWYTSYGSNMCRERFMCYLQGGRVEGMRHSCVGCSDPTPPLRDTYVPLPHHLYFAKHSQTWGGGVAFIDASPMEQGVADDEEAVHLNPTTQQRGAITHGRSYLLTFSQFCSVVAQENGKTERQLGFHLDRLSAKPTTKVTEGWYGLVVYLGEREGAPMFTFTNEQPMSGVQRTYPPSSYLRVIAAGLLQLGFSAEEVRQYLLARSGLTHSTFPSLSS